MFRKLFAETQTGKHSNNNFPLNYVIIIHPNSLFFICVLDFFFFPKFRLQEDNLWHNKQFANNPGAISSSIMGAVQPWNSLWAHFNEPEDAWQANDWCMIITWGCFCLPQKRQWYWFDSCRWLCLGYIIQIGAGVPPPPCHIQCFLIITLTRTSTRQPWPGRQKQ